MEKFYSKITNSKTYKITKRIVLIDNDKKFLVSSISYYLTISLVPLLSLILFFTNLFDISNNYTNIILQHFNIKTSSFPKNIFLIISEIISISIASKGILNYFTYINEKFNISPLPYHFITSRIYSFFLTIFICFILSAIISINYYLSSLNIPIIKMFNWSFNLISIFIILLLLNYFLLRRKIKATSLIIGSITSSFLLNITFSIYQNYLFNKQNSINYFGSLQNVIILLLYIYLIAYFITLGNQINFIIYKKEVSQLPN